MILTMIQAVEKPVARPFLPLAAILDRTGAFRGSAGGSDRLNLKAFHGVDHPLADLLGLGRGMGSPAVLHDRL